MSMKFYVLSMKNWDSNLLHLDTQDWSVITCPENEKHNRLGPRIGDMQVRFKTKRTCNFNWAPGSECLIDTFTIDAFSQAGFTGLGAFDATVYSKDGQLMEGFKEFKPLGRGGEADNIIIKFKCDVCDMKRYKATDCTKEASYNTLGNTIQVNVSNWDGSDFFWIDGFKNIKIVTERVFDLIKKLKITGLDIYECMDLSKVVYRR
jgi:hypothetical protein